MNMAVQFTKYHGTGNDFIIIDDREESFDIKDANLINEMCSRRFGIGADGLILLRMIKGYDFQMVYFNSDGNQSSMCGNGGRCIVQFAYNLGVINEKCTFLAIDGPHEAYVLGDYNIKLKMGDVDKISKDGDALILDTGSPHYVMKVDDVNAINVKNAGASIRYSKNYIENGINVNFLAYKENGVEVATYERGVEDETYSCGTGVTASAIVANTLEPIIHSSPVSILTKGGELKVYFAKISEGSYSDIWLEGPAVVTFQGEWGT